MIHAGIYYEKGSNMAHCCVRGADLIYDYCEAKGLPVKRTGKLICAPDIEDEHHLHTLYEKGTYNGVQGLQILNREQVG